MRWKTILRRQNFVFYVLEDLFARRSMRKSEFFKDTVGIFRTWIDNLLDNFGVALSIHRICGRAGEVVDHHRQT